jgi:hypothetical protein
MSGDRSERPERDALLVGVEANPSERNKALGDMPMYRQQSSTAAAVAQGQQASPSSRAQPVTLNNPLFRCWAQSLGKLTGRLLSLPLFFPT